MVESRIPRFLLLDPEQPIIRLPTNLGAQPGLGLDKKIVYHGRDYN